MSRRFGEKLRLLRRRRHITQGTLARDLDLDSHAHISNLEVGRRVPSLDLILRVANLFEVTTDYLLRDSVPIEQPISFVDVFPPNQQTTLQLFGAKLRYLRIHHTMTQSELARQLALTTHAHISLLETSRSDPSLDLVVQIAEVFGVSTDYLLRDTLSVDVASAKRGDKE